MPKLPKLTIAAKLYAIFALIATVTIALAIIAAYNARRNAELTNEFDMAFQSAQNVERINSLIYAVEMESQIIRAICRAHEIPSATIRVISDAAHENLPVDFNVFMTKKELNYGRLILALLGSPSKIPAMLRLQRQTQLAARNLAHVLSRLFLADA